MADIALVVKIDEKTYNDIKKGKVYTSIRDVPQESVLAIKNGTPLPVGHGDLIDQNYLLNILRCEDYENCTWRNCSECNRERCIKNMRY